MDQSKIDAARAKIAQGQATVNEGVAELLEATAPVVVPPKLEPKPVEPKPPVVEPPKPDASLVVVKSAGELTAMLKAAKGGERIKVTGDLGALTLKGLNFKLPVSIEAAGAKAKSLMLTDVFGLEIAGLDFGFSQVRTSGRLRFSGLKVHDATVTGLHLISCAGVLVEGCDFARLKNGVVHADCTDITVQRNTFRGMTSDGVTGGGTSKLLIEGNDFADFAPSAGAHPDAIQIFMKNTNGPAEDIIIGGNKIRRGAGGIPQGIFITGQNTGKRYKRVRIEGNVIEGAMHNGINVSSADGVEITGNTVQPYTGQNSRIHIEDCAGVTVSGNAYAQLTQGAGNSGVKISDKATLMAVAP